MKYDIHFSIAAAVIFVLLLLSIRFQYNNGQNTVKKLRDLIICLLLADLTDVISAYTIAYKEFIPVWLNYVTNTAFFVLETICMALLPRYVRYVVDPVAGKKTVMDRINEGLVFLYVLICISSFYTHLIFYFDENYKYRHGTIYESSYILGLYFMIFAFIRLMSRRKEFAKRQLVSIIGFIIIALSGSIAQFFMPDSLFILYFFFSVAAFIGIYGLETPDYIKLEKALGELKTSQKELEEAVIRAEAADVAKSDFLANMSHEIRTPINAILGMNELISRETTEPSVETYSNNIADAGQSLLALINDILDFSKIEAGRMELVEDDYELSNLLREVNNIIRIRCENKGLKFKINNNEKIPGKLKGDDVRIRQILINLLNNAFKYTDKGSVTLDVDYKDVEDGKIELILSVKDTGIGIRKEDIPALGESFKRVDLQSNRRREGTGLGLSITKAFIDMMHGYLEVDSVYGEGSVFTAHIIQDVVDTTPIGVFNEKATTVKKEKHKASFRVPSARLLIVDDVRMNLMVMKGFLKKTEADIDMVMSGEECLEKVKQNKYDIIFLDHMMPGMDGIETLKRMKEDTEQPNQTTPVIMLTANAILGAREEYMALGLNDYLSKPVDWKQLENMLVKYIPEDKIEKLSE
ncbi:MAG: response regulator [Lachnospiraceae bacterium]|nr:response regulator [Candidatus Merdinaster equi]